MKQLSRRRTRRTLLEGLETRRLFAFSVATPIPDVFVTPGTSAPTSVSLAGRYTEGTLAKFHFSTNDPTSTGDVYVELTDSVTPATVANFLSYVNAQRYDNSIIHRLIDGFVMQGGGFAGANFNVLSHITTNASVVNEFTQAKAAVGGGKVNVRGTIAMAKVGGDPNSATSEWFFNLADNSSNLDNQNGGFTTFGTVVSGMSLVDYIAANVPTYNGGGAFTDIPLVNFVNDHTPTTADFLNLQSVTVASGYTYAVTANSNPAFVTPTIVGNALSFAYGAPFGSSTITITATDPVGRTVTDTFDLVVPQIGVTVGSTAVVDNQATAVSLGSPTQGATASKTFRVANDGSSPLSFAAPTVPAGYVISSPADLSAVTLAPGEFVDVTVTSVATNTGGAKAGTLVLNTNDPVVPAFDIPLTYTVLTRQVGVSLNGTNRTNNQSLDLGTSSAASFTFTLAVKNNGTGTLALSAPTIPAGYFIVQGLPSTLAAGASANLVLAVDTTTVGTKAGNIVINSDDPNTPNFNIPVTADVSHAVTSVVLVNGDSTTTALSGPVAYPAIDQNPITPNSKTFRITNNGNTALVFSPVTEPAGFFISSPARTFHAGSPSTPPNLGTLAPGASIDIVITQRGDTGGDKSGTLYLNTNDPNTPAFGIQLSGFTHYRKLEVAYAGSTLVPNSSTHVTSQVDFGSGAEGTAYHMTFHVTNTGDTLNLTVTAPTLPAGFSLVTSFATPLVLGPGQSADIIVAVDTSSPGTRAGTIVFNSTDPVYALPVNAPGYRVPVTAVVNYRRLVVTDSANAPVSSGASFNFGTMLQGDTSVVTYHLTNTGNLPLSLSNPTLPTGFALASAFPTTLAPGASADIVLSLESLGRGTYSGAFTFNTNDATHPTFAINLAGKVIAKGIVVSLDGTTIPYGQASTIDFGKVRQGTTGQQVTFTISNSGLLPLSFQSASLPVGYTLVQSLPDTLAPGASAQLTVSLDTSNPGIYNGVLHIVSSDQDRPSFDIPVTAGVTLPVKLGAGGASSVTFTDADGTLSTITLTGPGSATLDFLGNNLVANTSAKKALTLKSLIGRAATAKGTTVTGSSVTLSGITLAGTSAGKTKLVITSKGGKVKTFDLGDVSGSPLLSLSATAAKLVGRMALNVKGLDLAAASGATLQLMAGSTVNIPVVTSTDLTTAGNVKSLKVNSWSGGTITAASIDSLSVNGNFTANLTLKKPLNNATIKGNVGAGTWTLNGGISKLTVSGSVLAGWVATAAGTVNNFTVAKNFSGSLTAKLLGLTVNGSVTNATLTAKSTVTSLAVKGQFANSNVTAKAITKATLGTIKTRNGGTPFGFTSLSIASLTAKLDTGKSLKLTAVNSTSKLTTQLTAQKVGALNDLKIQIA